MIEVVVINWKKPGNVLEILKAFRRQTLPCKITLCECAPPEFRLCEEGLSIPDEVISWKTNFGSGNRFIPLGVYRSQFTYFHDDDMLPGDGLLKFMMNNINDAVGLLGQFGRLLSSRQYQVKDVEFAGEVDCVVRGYFLRTVCLENYLPILNKMDNLDFRCDDLILAAAVQFSGLKVKMVKPTTDNEKMSLQELDKKFSLRLDGDHVKKRQEAVSRLLSLGWKSLSDK